MVKLLLKKQKKLLKVLCISFKVLSLQSKTNKNRNYENIIKVQAEFKNTRK